MDRARRQAFRPPLNVLHLDNNFYRDFMEDEDIEDEDMEDEDIEDDRPKVRDFVHRIVGLLKEQ